MRIVNFLLGALDPPTTVEDGDRVATTLDNILTLLGDADPNALSSGSRPTRERSRPRKGSVMDQVVEFDASA